MQRTHNRGAQRRTTEGTMARKDDGRIEDAIRAMDRARSCFDAVVGMPGAVVTDSFDGGFSVRLNPAFGLEADARVRVEHRERRSLGFKVEVSWCGCGGSPADGMAQAHVLSVVAQAACMAQACLARVTFTDAQHEEIAHQLRHLAAERRGE